MEVKRPRLWLILPVAALLLAGCSGSDSDTGGVKQDSGIGSRLGTHQKPVGAPRGLRGDSAAKAPARKMIIVDGPPPVIPDQPHAIGPTLDILFREIKRGNVDKRYVIVTPAGDQVGILGQEVSWTQGQAFVNPSANAMEANAPMGSAIILQKPKGSEFWTITDTSISNASTVPTAPGWWPIQVAEPLAEPTPPAAAAGQPGAAGAPGATSSGTAGPAGTGTTAAASEGKAAHPKASDSDRTVVTTIVHTTIIHTAPTASARPAAVARGAGMQGVGTRGQPVGMQPHLLVPGAPGVR